MNAQETVVNIEKQIEIARSDLAQANDAFSAALSAYDASFEEGRDAAKAARAVRDDAEIDRDINVRRLEKLNAALTDARAVADEARVEGLVEKAREAALSFEAAVRRDLPKMTTMARKLVRLWADAEAARKVAAHASGDESILPPVEGFRYLPGRPRQEIETRRVKRWVFPASGHPLSDDQINHIYKKGSETYLKISNSSDLLLGEQVEFDKIVYFDAERGPSAASILEELFIPGLMAGDHSGWSNPKSVNPNSVLVHLDRLESAPTANQGDQRERKVILREVPRIVPAVQGDAEDDE